MTPATAPTARIIDRDAATFTVRVPMAFARRGGRKVVIAPDGSAHTPVSGKSAPRIDNTVVKALARAFRWQRLLDGGDYGSIAELADSENLNRSYVSRVLRLTLLAPEIVEAILDGTLGPEATLGQLLEPFPAEWRQQRASFKRPCRTR